jgi:heme/copper-type cytochrome/quinol oxidase subunit 4
MYRRIAHVSIVFLVVAGSLWIMNDLSGMMPHTGSLNSAAKQ